MHRINGKWITGTPKSDAGQRTVALPSLLGPVLTTHLDQFVGEPDDALVFATRSGHPLARSNWTATFGRARKEVGLPTVHFHDLRPRAALIYQHAASDRDRDRDHAIARALDKAAKAAQTGMVGTGSLFGVGWPLVPRSGAGVARSICCSSATAASECARARPRGRGSRAGTRPVKAASRLASGPARGCAARTQSPASPNRSWRLAPRRPDSPTHQPAWGSACATPPFLHLFGP